MSNRAKEVAKHIYHMTSSDFDVACEQYLASLPEFQEKASNPQLIRRLVDSVWATWRGPADSESEWKGAFANFLAQQPEFREKKTPALTSSELGDLCVRRGANPAAVGAWPDFKRMEYLSIAQEKKSEWVKCADRMPNIGDLVFWYDGRRTLDNGACNNKDTAKAQYTHWMPRYVPPPPEPEESPLVRYLRCLDYGCNNGTKNNLIEEIKGFEQKGK